MKQGYHSISPRDAPVINRTFRQASRCSSPTLAHSSEAGSGSGERKGGRGKTAHGLIIPELADAEDCVCNERKHSFTTCTMVTQQC